MSASSSGQAAESAQEVTGRVCGVGLNGGNRVIWVIVNDTTGITSEWVFDRQEVTIAAARSLRTEAEAA